MNKYYFRVGYEIYLVVLWYLYEELRTMKACEICIEDYDWDDGASKLHRMFEEEETAKSSRRM
jgi:hypothetical protein